MHGLHLGIPLMYSSFVNCFNAPLCQCIHARDSGREKWAIAIHGGAGSIDRGDGEALKLAREGLTQALEAGKTVLSSGGSALDACEAAVRALEDAPSFNAGKGAVRTTTGRFELESSIMTSTGQCGSVTLIKKVKNPVSLARLVMETSDKTGHVMLSGPGAEAMAEEHGLEMCLESYYETEQRTKEWKASCNATQDSETVGAVCLDVQGRLCAATSTGGRTGKLDGRIGDTPIIGSGTYCCEEVAVSGTGIGEQFIRHVVGHEIAARVRFDMREHETRLMRACQGVVRETLKKDDGGVIAVDRAGNISMEFNTKGMFRGAADSKGRSEVAIFPNE